MAVKQVSPSSIAGKVSQYVDIDLKSTGGEYFMETSAHNESEYADDLANGVGVYGPSGTLAKEMDRWTAEALRTTYQKLLTTLPEAKKDLIMTTYEAMSGSDLPFTLNNGFMAGGEIAHVSVAEAADKKYYTALPGVKHRLAEYGDADSIYKASKTTPVWVCLLYTSPSPRDS